MQLPDKQMFSLFLPSLPGLYNNMYTPLMREEWTHNQNREMEGKGCAVLAALRVRRFRDSGEPPVHVRPSQQR